jgi:hypothetical protein
MVSEDTLQKLRHQKSNCYFISGLKQLLVPKVKKYQSHDNFRPDFLETVRSTTKLNTDGLEKSHVTDLNHLYGCSVRIRLWPKSGHVTFSSRISPNPVYPTTKFTNNDGL